MIFRSLLQQKTTIHFNYKGKLRLLTSCEKIANPGIKYLKKKKGKNTQRETGERMEVPDFAFSFFFLRNTVHRTEDLKLK